MNIKNIANTVLEFTIKRLIEISGLVLLLLGFLLLIALISYSPDDPNFIFTENTEIKNILGFRGSYISDLFFQSIGLIAFLIVIGTNWYASHIASKVQKEERQKIKLWSQAISKKADLMT